MEASPPLTLRPAMMACQSSETHVSSAVLYHQQHQYEAVAAPQNGAVLHCDVSDTNQNTMTLLRNVESVYFQNMTSEDEKNKVLREKMHAEDQVRRLIKDKDQLQQLLTQEKARRTYARLCPPARRGGSATHTHVAHIATRGAWPLLGSRAADAFARDSSLVKAHAPTRTARALGSA